MADMLTRLSINVATKDEAKEPVATLIANAVIAAGGSVAQRKGDKHGVYLSVELPAGFSTTMGSKPGAPLSVPAANWCDGLLPMSKHKADSVSNLLLARALAEKLLGSDDDTLRQSVAAPDFISTAHVANLVRDSAREEIARCDLCLASHGFRYAQDAQ